MNGGDQLNLLFGAVCLLTGLGGGVVTGFWLLLKTMGRLAKLGKPGA